MYVKKDREQQKQLKIISIEDLVPKDHILRDIDKGMEVKGKTKKQKKRPNFS